MKSLLELTQVCQCAVRKWLSVAGATLAGGSLGALGGALFGTVFALPFSLLYWDPSRIADTQVYFACCGALAGALTLACNRWIDVMESPSSVPLEAPDLFESNEPSVPIPALPQALARRMTAVQLER